MVSFASVYPTMSVGRFLCQKVPTYAQYKDLGVSIPMRLVLWARMRIAIDENPWMKTLLRRHDPPSANLAMDWTDRHVLTAWKAPLPSTKEASEPSIGIHPLPSGLVVDGQVQDEMEMAAVLQYCCAETGLRKPKVAMALSPSLLRQQFFPMDDPALQSKVPNGAELSVLVDQSQSQDQEMPSEEMVFDARPDGLFWMAHTNQSAVPSPGPSADPSAVQSDASNATSQSSTSTDIQAPSPRWWLVGAPASTVADRIALFALVKVSLVRLDIRPAALLRYFVTTRSTAQSTTGRHCLIDGHAGYTSHLIIDQGVLQSMGHWAHARLTLAEQSANLHTRLEQAHSECAFSSLCVAGDVDPTVAMDIGRSLGIEATALDSNQRPCRAVVTGLLW